MVWWVNIFTHSIAKTEWLMVLCHPHFVKWNECIVNSIVRVPKLPGKPGILSFTFPGLENAWNLLENWKTWNFNSKPGKKLYFVNFCFSRFIFQDVIFKKNLIYVCHMGMINIGTKNLEFRTKNLEKTKNLVFGKKWEPWLLEHDFACTFCYSIDPLNMKITIDCIIILFTKVMCNFVSFSAPWAISWSGNLTKMWTPGL